MKNKAKELIAQQKAGIASWFEKAGATIADLDTYGGYATSERYYFRWFLDKNLVEIGVRKCFDRWANSRDFRLDFIPDSELAFDAFMAALEAECAAGHYDTGCGVERDLYAAYRRERKRLRAERRLPVEEECEPMVVNG